MKILLTIFSFVFSSIAFGKTIVVGKNETCKTITSALVIAVDGDTVFVNTGEYHEGNIVITKKIVLLANGKAIIDGDYKFENLSVKANGVVIDGFVIRNSGISSMTDYAGIKIYNAHNVVISNNILENTFFGIYTQYGTSCIIRNNILTAHNKEEQQSGNGIHCWKSDSMQIIGNKISGHRDGIYFEFVTHSIIWRNYSHNNLRYGLHFMFSNDDAYITNEFEDNGAGVAVMFSHGVKMFNNFFRKNWGDAAYGILLKEISDSYIIGNHFEENTSAIYMEGASRVQVQKNVFANNGWALKIQASCMNDTVQYNNFKGNTFDVGTNGSLVLNNFDHNYWDKYEGYDLNKDRTGDVPYRPVSLYSMIVEKNPPATMLFRSFITTLMDKTEKVVPGLTPENLKDEYPLMKPFLL